MQGEAAVDSSLQPSGDLGGNDLEEDEEHLKAADQFEAQHNFRFEASYQSPLVTCQTHSVLPCL